MISRNSLYQAIKTKQQHYNLAVLECHQRVQPKRREPLNAIGWASNASFSVQNCVRRAQ